MNAHSAPLWVTMLRNKETRRCMVQEHCKQYGNEVHRLRRYQQLNAAVIVREAEMSHDGAPGRDPAGEPMPVRASNRGRRRAGHRLGGWPGCCFWCFPWWVSWCSSTSTCRWGIKRSDVLASKGAQCCEGQRDPLAGGHETSSSWGFDSRLDENGKPLPQAIYGRVASRWPGGRRDERQRADAVARARRRQQGDRDLHPP